MSEHAVELRARSLADTRAIAEAVATVVRLGDVVLLAGQMGTGKTTFAQAFGRAWGVNEPITSPTFTLVHSYDVAERRATLHHADLYRLERTAEIADLSLLELSEDRGVVLVEWGEVAEQFVGDHLTVLLERDDELDELDAAGDAGGETGEWDFGLDEGRLVSISAAGRSWAPRWSTLVDSVEVYRC